jgi:hypothetical protein
MKFSGTNWVYVGDKGFSSASIAFPSLTFAPDGTPFVAYMNALPIDIKKFDGTNWVSVDVTSFANANKQFVSESIIYDKKGMLVAAYAYQNSIIIRAFNGSGWTLAAPSQAQSTFTPYTIALAPDGTLSMLYKTDAGSVVQALAMIKTCTSPQASSVSSSSSSRSSLSSRVSLSSSLPSSSAATKASVTASCPNTDTRTVQTLFLNVRADSRMSAAVLWEANRDDIFQILRVVHDDWAQIQTTDGRKGYVWVHNLSDALSSVCSSSSSSVSSAVSGCVSTASSTTLGSKSLSRPHCITNAGQSVGVHVTPSARP